MPSFLTQCPHCLTSFRVTDRQLDAAEGLVRCGACLGIFSADANRIKVKPTPEEAAAAAAQEPDDFDDDDVGADALPDTDADVLDDFDEFDEPGDLDPLEEEAPALEELDEFDDTDEAEESDEVEPEDTNAYDATDEEEANDEPVSAPQVRIVDAEGRDLLDPEDDFDIPLGDLNLDVEDDDHDATGATATVDDEDEYDEEEPEEFDDEAEIGITIDAYEVEIRRGDASKATGIEEEESGQDDSGIDDETPRAPSLIDIVYEEYGDEEAVQTEQVDDDDSEQSEEFEAEFIFDDDYSPAVDTIVYDAAEDDEEQDEEYAEDDEDSEEDEYEVPPPIAPRFSARRDNDKAALHHYLADIEDDEALDPLDDEEALDFDEPVLLEEAPRRSRWVGFVLLLANLALVALLAWQYADSNIERLSRSASFAPLLPFACRVLDCPAPQHSQPDLFVSEQLLVRSHPRYAQALEVNIVFRNDAAEAQPFPALELGFHDTSNRMVANRLFQPAEYLPPELQTSEMPAQSSFQVTLELVDPGSDAVNYTLGFRAP